MKKQHDGLTPAGQTLKKDKKLRALVAPSPPRPTSGPNVSDVVIAVLATISIL